MKRYDSYKDSGVKWLGEIPSHWEIMPIKRIARTYAGATPSSNNDKNWGGSIPWITPADFKTETKYVEKGNRFLTEQGLNSCSTTLVPAKSVIFSKRAPVGQLSIATQPLCTNQGCISCVPLSVIDSSFLFYLLSIYKDTFESLSSGTTFKEISQKSFSDFKISIPPINEQIKMVNYLDTATSKLDKAIAQQQKMIDLLNERKQIIINKAVTKGLNPNVKMKPSGIDWIGDIPEHWKTIRIKYLLKESKEKSQSGNEEPLSMSQVYGLIPTKEMDVIPNMASSFVGAKLVTKGDLVFNKLKAHLGVFNVSKYDGLVSPDYAVYSSIGRADLSFLEYIFKTPRCINEFIKLITGVGAGLSRLYTSDLFSIYCAIPPLPEQRCICNYIEENTQKIKLSISRCQRQISLLQERKQIIINDVVTGKVKVEKLI